MSLLYLFHNALRIHLILSMMDLQREKHPNQIIQAADCFWRGGTEAPVHDPTEWPRSKSKADPGHPAEEAHIRRLYLSFLVMTHISNLNIDQ